MPRGSLSLDVKIATVQAMLDMGFVSLSATSGDVAERVASEKGDEGLKKLIVYFISNTFESIKKGRPVRALQGIKCYEDLVKAAENSPRTDASITRRRGRPMKATKMNPAVDSSDDIGFTNSVIKAVEQDLTEHKMKFNEMGVDEFKVNLANIFNRSLGANFASSAGTNPTAPSSSNGRDYVPQSRAKSRPSVPVTSRLRSCSVGAPVVVKQRLFSVGKPLEEIVPIPPRNAASDASTPSSSCPRRRIASVRPPRAIPTQGKKIGKSKEPATTRAVAATTAVKAENNPTAPSLSNGRDYVPQSRAKSRPSAPVASRLRSCSVGAPVVVKQRLFSVGKPLEEIVPIPPRNAASDASTPSSSRPRRRFASVRPPRAIPIQGNKIGKSKEPATTRAVAATTAVKAENNPTAPSSSNGRDYVPQSRAKSRPSAPVASRLRSCSVGAPVVVKQRLFSVGKPLEEIVPIPPRNAASDASTPSSSRPRRRFASVRPPRAIPIQGNKIGKSKEPATTRAVAATTAVKAENNPTAPSSSNGRDYVPQSRAKSRPSAPVASRLRSCSVGAPVVVKQRLFSVGKPLEEIVPIPPRNAASDASTPSSSRPRRRFASVRPPRAIPIQGNKIGKSKEPATTRAVAATTAVKAENTVSAVRHRRCASTVQKIGPTPKKTGSMTIGFSPAAAKQLEKNMESVMKDLLDKALKEQIAPFMTEMIESTLRKRCPDQPADAAPAQLQAEPAVQLKVEAAPSSENGSADQAFNASGEMMKQMVEIMTKQTATMANCMATLHRVVSGENGVGIPSTPASGLSRL